MRNVEYGTCFVRYAEEETKVYIKYYKTSVYNSVGQKALVYVCKDLISGTPLKTIPLLDSAKDVYEAAQKHQIKKSYLVAYYIDFVEKEDMVEMLKSMDDSKIKEYVDRIEKAKVEYSEAIRKATQDKKEMAKLKKIKDKDLNSEMENEVGRVNGIAKRILKR